MRKKLIVLLSALFILIAAFLIFFFSRPSVAFLSSELPDGFSMEGPSFMTSRYRRTGNAGNASLVIVMPSVAVPDVDGTTVLVGRAAEDGESPDISLPLDFSSMWGTALGEWRECILYESSDRHARSLAASLLESDENAFELTYSGRVSVANAVEIEAGIESADVVFYLTPSTSERILRSSAKPAVLDFIHNGALERTASYGYVGIDWDSTVDALLSGRSELSYAFFPSEDTV